MTTLLEQVRQARATFDEAHITAETAIARHADLKTKVGGNESERKTAKANTPEDVYAGYLTDYAAAELDKIAKVAHLERVEKNLNTLREELQRETADVMSRASDRQFEAAALLIKSYDRLFEAVSISDTTAQRYLMMSGNKTTFAEMRARANNLKPVTVPPDDDSDLPF